MACGIQIHILTSARKISFYLRRATLERLLHFGILYFYISWQLCSRVSQVQVAACILELFFSLPPDTKNLCERKTDALFQPIRKKVRCYHWHDQLRPIWLFPLLSCIALGFWAEQDQLQPKKNNLTRDSSNNYNQLAISFSFSSMP